MQIGGVGAPANRSGRSLQTPPHASIVAADMMEIDRRLQSTVAEPTMTKGSPVARAFARCVDEQPFAAGQSRQIDREVEIDERSFLDRKSGEMPEPQSASITTRSSGVSETPSIVSA